MENEHAPPATIEPVGHVENALNLQLPAKGTAGNFANHAWQQAMGYTQAPPPRLPGAAAGQTVRHIALIPRKAIKARVEEIGKFMNCSIAIIKRHAQSDTPQRINLAHDASGCTK